MDNVIIFDCYPCTNAYDIISILKKFDGEKVITKNNYIESIKIMAMRPGELLHRSKQKAESYVRSIIFVQHPWTSCLGISMDDIDFDTLFIDRPFGEKEFDNRYKRGYDQGMLRYDDRILGGVRHTHQNMIRYFYKKIKEWGLKLI